MSKVISTEPKFRTLRRADIPALCKLMDTYERELNSRNNMKPADIARYCLGPRKMATAWLALVNDKPVGFALTGDWVSFGGPFKVCHIYHLFVLEKLRAQGIATSLLREIVKDAFVKGYGRVDITAAPDNKNANRLYKKLGFSLKSAASRYQLYRPQ